MRRVVSYAAANGHHQFAALVPQTAYGDVAQAAFDEAVHDAGGTVVDVEHFAPNATAAVMRAGQGRGQKRRRCRADRAGRRAAARHRARRCSSMAWTATRSSCWAPACGTIPTLAREASLEGGWYAAPAPNADADFISRYRAAFGAAPPQLASLAYDAVALVALLSPGTPYHRFTQAALMDPNGFAGVNGIFRFNADGTSERGLAVLEVTADRSVVGQPRADARSRSIGSKASSAVPAITR